MASKGIQAIILTEAGSARGHGHLSRCTGLLEAFNEAGCNAQLWVDSDQPLPPSLAAGGQAGIGNWKQNLERFLPANNLPTPITVVDSYEADRKLLETIASRSRRCCFFDDFARLHYPDGILINAAFGADSLYPVRRQEMRYLTGPRYAVLRKAFRQGPAYRVQQEIERVLIFLGGAGRAAEAQEVGNSVRSVFPEAQVALLHPGAATAAQRQDGILWAWESDPERFVQLALRHDLAICAGGQTLLEMACLGVPSISLLTAENQQANTIGLQKAGFSASAGSLDNSEHLDGLIALLQEYRPFETRARRSKIGRKLIDGKGALRITAECSAVFCDEHQQGSGIRS